MRRQIDAKSKTSRQFARSVRRNRILAFAILAILALAAIAPVGQASDQANNERAAQRATIAAERAAEREAIKLQREAAKNARQQAKATKEAARHSKQLALEQKRAEARLTEHADVTINCESIVVQYHGFPGSGENAISQKIIFKQKPGPTPTIVFPSTYQFTGENSTETISIAAPLGESGVGLRGHFVGTGMKGGFNVHETKICGPIPRFTIETLQSISTPFKTDTLPGEVGQTVTYDTNVTNTGNTPMTFTGFSDPKCDGSVAGGPNGVIGPRSAVTYVCTHTLTDADREAEVFANSASVTGTPEPGQGEPVTETSKGVNVTPIAARGTATTTGSEVTTGSAPAAAGPSKSGVLDFSSSAIPSLLGPLKCIRGTFTVSVKSTGVANVIFYIDGRKLARRTVHSQVKGLISIHVNGALLKAGSHRLLAKITMASGSTTTKAVTASRSRTVRRCRTAKITATRSR
jgi:hypothetical protein